MELDIPIDVCLVVKDFYQIIVNVYGRGKDSGQLGRGVLPMQYITEFKKLKEINELVTDDNSIHVFDGMFIVHNKQQHKLYVSGCNFYGKCGIGRHLARIYKFTPIPVPLLSPDNPIVNMAVIFCG